MAWTYLIIITTASAVYKAEPQALKNIEMY